MSSKRFKLTLSLVLFSFAFSFSISAQSDKEIIIIEKTIDQNGNEISKKIIRKSGEEVSDEELEQLMKEEEIPFGQWDIQSLGFGPNAFENWGGWDNKEENQSNVTIGLNLSFEKGRNIITDVVRGSGAEDADIRAGDELIAVDGISISTIEEIKRILEQKELGDELIIKVYRDGEEIEKIVLLKNSNRATPFPFSKDINGKSFLFDFDKMFNMDFDSILNFREGQNLDSIFRNFDGGFQPFHLEKSNRTSNKSNKASLGVFIDEDNRAIIVADVLNDSAAAKAGIIKGDIIARIDDNIVTSYSELVMIMNQKKSGDNISVEIKRDNKTKVVKVLLD